MRYEDLVDEQFAAQEALDCLDAALLPDMEHVRQSAVERLKAAEAALERYRQRGYERRPFPTLDG